MLQTAHPENERLLVGLLVTLEMPVSSLLRLMTDLYQRPLEDVPQLQTQRAAPWLDSTMVVLCGWASSLTVEEPRRPVRERWSPRPGQ